MMNKTTKQMERNVNKITAKLNKLAADDAVVDDAENAASDSSASSDSETTDDTQDFQQGED